MDALASCAPGVRVHVPAGVEVRARDGARRVSSGAKVVSKSRWDKVSVDTPQKIEKETIKTGAYFDSTPHSWIGVVA